MLAALVQVFAAEARAVTMAWSPVGNPGNAADTVTPNPGVGAVGHDYKIGTYDVTNSQYAEFLNTTDPTGMNTLALWDSHMSFPSTENGGINFTLSNASGNKYTPVPSRENRPVNWVNWYSAVRFANWLNNGQGSSDTESGAYALLGGTPIPSNGSNVARSPGAIVFLPSEDEWYKAAYYNSATSSYFLYPTSSDVSPIASDPTGLPNHANFLPGGANSLTDVGAYTSTISPYGAFDMGGNVSQWDEDVFWNWA